MFRTIALLSVCIVVLASCTKKTEPNASNTPVPQNGTSLSTTAKASALIVEPTDITTVASGVMQSALEATGTLKAVRQVTVKSKTVGEVVELSLLEGQPVKKGQLLARIDDIESNLRLRERQAQMQSAKAQLELASRTFENQQQLFQRGFISQAALDNAQTQLNVARAAVDSSSATLSIANKAITDTRLISPISGVVAERYVQLGEKVGLDARVMLIIDDTSLELETLLQVADTAKLAAGSSVTVKPEGATSVIGKITRINPSTSAGTRLVPVHIEMSNAGGKLKQGQFASVTIVTGKKDNVIAISPDAIREVAGRNFVYVVGADNKVIEQDVQLGERGSNTEARDVVLITKGLTAGSRIVANNLGPLRAGTVIQLRGATKG
jgi:membrane fusion protein, multidrug efflux system